MHLSSTLSKKILAWYDNSKRNLPWRVSKKSPKKLYYRLLSEFMLQQTQVKTVVPYFKKFTKKYKTLKSLSKANETQILKMWEGLGYYRRARNLLAAAKLLVKEHNSKLPNTLKEIKKLPGVGDYTANALMGFIHNYPTIAIDGNVKRVFARYLNKKESKIDFKKLIDINKKNNNKNQTFIQGLRPFSSSIPKTLKKHIRKGGYNYSNIVDNWTKMVSKRISDVCFPITVKMGKDMKDGNLVLNVIHGKEIEVEYKKKDIIDKINSFFGYNCIKHVTLKIVENTLKDNRKIFPKIKNFSKIEEKMNKVNDSDLKSSLNNFLKAFNERNK